MEQLDLDADDSWSAIHTAIESKVGRRLAQETAALQRQLGDVCMQHTKTVDSLKLDLAGLLARLTATTGELERLKLCLRGETEQKESLQRRLAEAASDAASASGQLEESRGAADRVKIALGMEIAKNEDLRKESEVLRERLADANKEVAAAGKRKREAEVALEKMNSKMAKKNKHLEVLVKAFKDAEADAGSSFD